MNKASMNVKLYHKIKIFFLSMLLCLCLCGCGKDEAENTKTENSNTKVVLTTGFAEDEIFRIGESSCCLAEAMVYMTNMQNQYESVYGTQIWKRTIGEDTLEEKVKDLILARLAQIKTMNLLAEQREIVLTEQEENLVSEAAGEYYGSLNATEIAAMKLDEEIIRQLYREYALANKMYNQIIESTNPEISDDEARTVTVSQILIKTYALDGNGQRVDYTQESKNAAYRKIRDIQSMLYDGGDFDELAARYSEAAQLTVSFCKGEKPVAYEEAAFNLGNEEVSQIFQIPDGYCILKCISTLDRDQTDLNKEKIIKERKEEAFTEIYDEFVKTQIRNLNEELWEEVEFIAEQQVKTASFFDVYNAYFEGS